MKLKIGKSDLKAMLNEAYEHGKNDNYYKNFLVWRDKAIKEYTEKE